MTVGPVSGGKEALARWMQSLATAPEGTQFEVGLSWDPERRWTVYQRIGEAMLTLAPATARRLHRTYLEMSKRQEWAGIEKEMKNTLGSLDGLAKEALQKNRDGIVPEGAAAYMQPATPRAQ